MATRNATVLPALVTLLLMAGPACAQEVGNAQQGKIVYDKYCVLCHGVQGDGKGHFSEATTPVPAQAIPVISWNPVAVSR